MFAIIALESVRKAFGACSFTAVYLIIQGGVGMKKYDVNCPCCGYKNSALYLEETEGWMECEKCGRAVQVTNRFGKHLKIPVFKMDHNNTAMTKAF